MKVHFDSHKRHSVFPLGRPNRVIVKSVVGCFAKNVRNKYVCCADTKQSSTLYSGWYIIWPLSLKWLITHICYMFRLMSLLKVLLLKNLFTDFTVTIKDKIKQDFYFVRNLWQLNRQLYFRRATYRAYFPVCHMQKYFASCPGSAHNFTLHVLSHELRWFRKY
jgi:hypothetical protein